MAGDIEQLNVLIDNGLTITACITEFAKRQTEDAERYIEAARERLHRDGVVEIDDPTITSGSDADGDYVLAWVWVADSDIDNEPANLCGQCGVREAAPGHTACSSCA